MYFCRVFYFKLKKMELKRLYIYCLAFFMLLCVPSKAQVLDASRWYDYTRSNYFGIRVGLNIATLHCRGLEYYPTTNPLAALNAGIVLGNKIGRTVPFFVETGIFYTEKGLQANAIKMPQIQKQVFKLQYIEIPLLFKYKGNVGFDDLTIQPFFGAFFAVGVKGTAKLYTEKKNLNAFTDDYFKRFDAGFRLGIGMAFQNLYLDFAYDIGLCNLAAKNFDEYGYTDFDGRIRTGTFAITAGLDF